VSCTAAGKIANYLTRALTIPVATNYETISLESASIPFPVHISPPSDGAAFTVRHVLLLGTGKRPDLIDLNAPVASRPAPWLVEPSAEPAGINEQLGDVLVLVSVSREIDRMDHPSHSRLRIGRAELIGSLFIPSVIRTLLISIKPSSA
jgi:hypothetical protein